MRFASRWSLDVGRWSRDVAAGAEPAPLQRGNAGRADSLWIGLLFLAAWVLALVAGMISVVIGERPF